MSNPKKILVAEDSSVIINLTKSVLSFENFEIKIAKNGQQVLKFLENESFDLILMDIGMPILDGEECVKAIREIADPVKSKIPVIAISGNIKNYSIEEFRKIGFDDFIQKPLDYDKLLNTVKKIFG